MAKVLVADDDPDILEILRLTLSIEGHEPFLASDGSTALERIQRETPDVVLLDVMMPVMDGWEVLRRVGEMNLRKRPRVIIMTAKGGDRDVERGIRLGACEYVTKPFEIDELVATIEEVSRSSEKEVEDRRNRLLMRFAE